MSLAAQMSALAGRLGAEIKGLIRPDHPGLARAWVNFGYVSSAIQLRSSHNVDSITRSSAGHYRITFATPFADNNYCWMATARSNTNSGTQRLAIVRSTSDQKTAQYVDISVMSSAGSAADSTEISLVVYR